MKKLLRKIEVEEQDMESNLEEFERRLKEVMRRYKIENEALATEIINLHRQSTHWFHKWLADFCIANFIHIFQLIDKGKQSDCRKMERSSL